MDVDTDGRLIFKWFSKKWDNYDSRGWIKTEPNGGLL
jgi:hypothetical protein